MPDSKKKVDLLKVAGSNDAEDIEFRLDATASKEGRVFPDSFAASGNVTMAPSVLAVPSED